MEWVSAQCLVVVERMRWRWRGGEVGEEFGTYRGLAGVDHSDCAVEGLVFGKEVADKILGFEEREEFFDWWRAVKAAEWS